MAEVEFNPEAKDGDNDGIVQEGTEFERPIEELEINPVEDIVEETIEEVVVEELEEAPVEDIVAAPEPAEEIQALTPVENGVIGAGKVSRKKSSAKVKSAEVDNTPKPERVAVFSTRNVTWGGVGKVYRGYNIVTKDAAEKWLTRDHCRLATPEEVAKEFGK